MFIGCLLVYLNLVPEGEGGLLPTHFPVRFKDFSVLFPIRVKDFQHLI